MKARIRFDALTCRGERVRKTITLDCPDFTQGSTTTIGGILVQGRSVDEQVISWLDNQDKSALMDEHDFSLILDYKVATPREKKQSFSEYIKTLGLEGQSLIDFLAVYHRIRPTLKGKSHAAAAHLVLSHLEVGQEAAIEAYRHSVEIIRSISESGDDAQESSHKRRLQEIVGKGWS